MDDLDKFIEETPVVESPIDLSDITFNYRVFYEIDRLTGCGFYSVRDAYYNRGESIPHSCAKEPDVCYLSSYTVKELKKDWELYGKAFSLPTLFMAWDGIRELTEADIVV